MTTESARSNAVEVQDLTKTYKGGVQALQGVTFSVQPGTVFALLGPNGAGKSTTVKILTTLTEPNSGTAIVAGYDVLRDANKVRQTIGCIAQKSGVDLDATGAENLALQGYMYGLRGKALKDRVDTLLARFGLSDAAHRVTMTYSGGMQRKLDVAMGLVHHPQVLFLDEPTTGLDPEARADMWHEIAHLSRDEGLTVLLTTHYLEEADNLADRIAIVDHGKIVAEGTSDELKGQLHGDAVQVELEDVMSEDQVRSALQRLNSHLRDLTLNGRNLRARVDSGSKALPTVLSALEAAGIGVASAGMARPTLDDVYLHHTGHTITEAEGVNA